MFNIFKKRETVKDVLSKPIPAKANYPTIVDKIHNEFYTAGESILQEATCLLKELEQKDLAKGKRLAALGFGKTREAAAAIETETKISTTKEIADLVIYYRINYPNNKFITEAQVKQICEKYGLVCGDTSMYKGFVPESKLPFIEGFKLKKADVPEIEVNTGGFCKISDVRGNSSFLDGSWWSVEWMSGEVNLSGGQAKWGKRANFRALKNNPPKLKICAPLKDMEIPQGKELKGYKIQDIPDPVVLQPVIGGYLIVCAWGDEASDEIVVNQNNN